MGMNQKQFAEAIGVSQTSVSRWIKHGDRPKAEHLEAMSDVLVIDYDFLITKAGYRPRELMLQVDPKSPEGILVPWIRKIAWDKDNTELFRKQLESWASMWPAKRKDAEDD